MNFNKVILVTGGCGFIGSHLVRHFVKKYPNYLIINLDALTYAANPNNLKDIEGYKNYKFIHGNICDKSLVNDIFLQCGITDVIHLAAESHVDNSIENPNIFVETNVIGTVNLLNAAKNNWLVFPWSLDVSHRFHHVSTDEVYGALDLDPNNKFVEGMPYNPHSPYSASKAASDHFVRSYHDTYGLDITISNCSNNYGSHQHHEKLIPKVINNLKNGLKIPLYGNGMNIRDWLYVEDHVKAIDLIFHEGKNGETYNIGGNNEKTNVDIINTIINSFNDLTNESKVFDEVVEYVTDRKGHDLRYAIDASKIHNELGWLPQETFESGIKKTVEFYLI